MVVIAILKREYICLLKPTSYRVLGAQKFHTTGILQKVSALVVLPERCNDIV